MRNNGLKLAPQNIEAIVVTNKNVYVDPESIPIKRHIRYLGVELNSRLCFTRHIAAASAKATESARAIGRPITGQTCAAGLSSKHQAPVRLANLGVSGHQDGQKLQGYGKSTEDLSPPDNQSLSHGIRRSFVCALVHES